MSESIGDSDSSEDPVSRRRTGASASRKKRKIFEEEEEEAANDNSKTPFVPRKRIYEDEDDDLCYDDLWKPSDRLRSELGYLTDSDNDESGSVSKILTKPRQSKTKDKKVEGSPLSRSDRLSKLANKISLLKKERHFIEAFGMRRESFQEWWSQQSAPRHDSDDQKPASKPSHLVYDPKSGSLVSTLDEKCLLLTSLREPDNGSFVATENRQLLRVDYFVVNQLQNARLADEDSMSTNKPAVQRLGLLPHAVQILLDGKHSSHSAMMWQEIGYWLRPFDRRRPNLYEQKNPKTIGVLAPFVLRLNLITALHHSVMGPIDADDIQKSMLGRSLVSLCEHPDEVPTIKQMILRILGHLKSVMDKDTK